jgi:hypothetical protein
MILLGSYFIISKIIALCPSIHWYGNSPPWVLKWLWFALLLYPEDGDSSFLRNVVMIFIIWFNIYPLTYCNTSSERLICLVTKLVPRGEAVDSYSGGEGVLFESLPGHRLSWPRFYMYLAGFLLELLLRPWRWRRYVPSKRQLTPNGLHGVISQKTILIEILHFFLNSSSQIGHDCFLPNPFTSTFMDSIITLTLTQS